MQEIIQKKCKFSCNFAAYLSILPAKNTKNLLGSRAIYSNSAKSIVSCYNEAELTLLKEDVLKGAGYNPESTDETGIQCRANGQRTPDDIRDNGRCDPIGSRGKWEETSENKEVADLTSQIVTSSFLNHRSTSQFAILKIHQMSSHFVMTYFHLEWISQIAISNFLLRLRLQIVTSKIRPNWKLQIVTSNFRTPLYSTGT